MNISTIARRSIAAAAAAILLLPATLHAGESEDFSFARRLQRDGMFVAAAEEYLRFAERYPASVQRPAALHGAGESWMQAGRAAEALEAFERLLAGYPGDDYACTARYYRGTIFKALRRYREAAAEMLLVQETGRECAVLGKALLEAGECFIAAGDWDEASRVLRGIWLGGVHREQIPRAGYSLSLALSGQGRDLEADRVLGEVVSKHPASPVAALASIMLGDRALEAGRFSEAQRRFRAVADRYDEESLRERALRKLIEAAAAAGDDRAALGSAREYLRLFPTAERRPEVYRAGIEAARRLEDRERVLELIGSWRAEGGVVDTTGAISLLRAEVLGHRGNTDAALSELREFRHTWTRSPLLIEALLLEGTLLERAGRPAEAALRYNLALLEDAGGAARLTTLGRLADLSLSALADTAGALRCWKMIVDEDPGGERGEEALWLSARSREASGDLRGAAAAYERLAREYGDGTYAAEAAGRAARLALLAGPGGDAAGRLARLAAEDALAAPIRQLEAGVILIEEAGRPEEASVYLESALKADLTDTDRARARYYLGRAHELRHELSAARGRPDEAALRSALNEYLAVARAAPGTAWGGRAERAYLEHRLADYKTQDRLQRLDDFLGRYGRDPDHYWWTARRRLEILYEAAPQAGAWAVDSALAVASFVLAHAAPDDLRREALVRSGYLQRLRGDNARAAESFAAFAARYSGDPRTAAVLFDLGEARFAATEYGAAREAYEACLAAGPARRLEARCRMRLGDSRYYLRQYSAAAAGYAEVAAIAPDAGLADEAAFRRALALRMAGETLRSDSILVALGARTDLGAGTRKRVLDLLGRRRLETGDFEGARAVFEQLVAAERSPEHLVLLAEALLGLERPAEAERRYGDALKIAGADTCRVLGGRARAFYAAGEAKKGSQDLDRLLRLCPGHRAAAGALLARGSASATAGTCEDAAQVLEYLRATYPETEEAAEALYHLALCDIKRGGYAEAIARLERLLGESPGSPIRDQAYFRLASAHYAAGSRNLAAANYALAAEATADAARGYSALANLARIHQELEEWDRAAAVWQRIVESYPGRDDIVELFFNLGFCYGQAGMFDMAREVYARIPSIAATEEQRGRAHYWNGIALKNSGRCDEALREFLRVPYLKTGGMWGVTSKIEAADCYERLGRREEAAGIYRQVISAHGERSDWGSLARKALERLEAGGGEGGAGPRPAPQEGRPDGS